MRTWQWILGFVLLSLWLAEPKSESGQLLFESVLILCGGTALVSIATRSFIRASRRSTGRSDPPRSWGHWGASAFVILLSPVIGMIGFLALFLAPFGLVIDGINTVYDEVSSPRSATRTWYRNHPMRLWHLILAVMLVGVVLGMWRDPTSRVALIVFVSGTGECALGTAALLALFQTLGAVGYASRPREYAYALLSTGLVLLTSTAVMMGVLWVAIWCILKATD
jgi:hypothetical protein